MSIQPNKDDPITLLNEAVATIERLSMSKAQASGKTGYSEMTLNRRIASGALPHFKIGSTVRIPVAALEALVVANGAR